MSLSFAVLERLRISARQHREEKTTARINSVEASTEHKAVITSKIMDIFDWWIKRTESVENIGAYFSTLSAILLLMQLAIVGVSPNITYNPCALVFFIIIPSFIMPIFIVLIYIALGLMSLKINIWVKKYKTSLDTVKEMNEMALLITTKPVQHQEKNETLVKNAEIIAKKMHE